MAAELWPIKSELDVKFAQIDRLLLADHKI
jgi:hypothetical protein